MRKMRPAGWDSEATEAERQEWRALCDRADALDAERRQVTASLNLLRMRLQQRKLYWQRTGRAGAA